MATQNPPRGGGRRKGAGSGGAARGRSRATTTATKAPRSGTGTKSTKSTKSTKTAKAPARRASSRRAGRAVSARRRGGGGGWGKRLWGGLKWTLVGAIWGLVALTALVTWYAYDLPDLDAAVTASRPPGLTVIAADGTAVASAGQVHGQAVTVDDVPPILIEAVLATEDRRFRDHWGVDPWGILRAAWANIRAGGVVQGGSTLTQQVAKTLFLSPDRTLRRKVQEALLALWLDHELSKDRILELYLNRVYLGAGTYGMDAAARRYFRRPAGTLTAYQAAVLAGLMKAPSRLNPAADADAAHARAREVLGNLVETGHLTRAKAERIAAEGRADLALARGAGTAGRYFGDWVLSRVDGHVGALNDDLTVRTTLIPAAQRAAEAALRGVLADPDVAAAGARQGAVVVMAPDGAVLAMVGGRDYADSQFNRAAQARRQPGSAFKPVVWLAALETGLAPDSTVQDAPVTVRGWSPRNHDDRYRGAVTLTEALAASINTVAVRLTEQAGRSRVARLARRLGLTEIDTEAPSMALGTIEVSPLALTAAYAPFVNGGRVVFPHGIRTVTNRAGDVVYRRVPSADPPHVASPAHARAMRRMLRAVVSWGTGKGAQPPASTGLTAYGKTGTTQESRDAWFVGFVEDGQGGAALAGVWIGDDQGRPMTDIGGGGPAARVFADLFARWQPGG